MGTSHPNGVRAPLDTCTGCGAESVEVNADEMCVDCEYHQVQTDCDVCFATLEILDRTVTAALNGHASPEDILRTVSYAIERMDTVPREPLSTLMDRASTLLAKKREAGSS